MKRGPLVALGVLLLVVGLALAAAGAVVAAWIGSDDSVSTAPARVQGTGVAVVAEDLRVDAGGIAIPDAMGSITLVVTGRTGRAMFVGVAQPSDVARYLSAAPHDVVVDLSAGATATTRAVPGTRTPALPASVAFWTASAAGAPASLSARVPPGTTLVVMNADAARGIDADVVVTLQVPHAWTFAWVAVGIGLLLAILGVVLLRRAARRRRTDETPAAALATPGPIVPPVAVLPASVPADGSLEVPSAGTPVPEEDLVAPASEALAALVLETRGPDAAAEPDEGRPVEVEPAPVGSPEGHADPDEPTAAVLLEGGGAPPDPDPDLDPLFTELVSAYGTDPVHDALPEPATAGEGRPHGPAASDGTSGSSPTGG